MQRKIPTAIGLFLTLVLVAGLAFATSQVSKVTRLFSQAEQSVAPTSIGFGNVSDIGFTVFWTTDKETSGAIFWGKTASLGDGTAVDDRDLAAPNGKYTTHFVRVTGLQASQKYYFKIGSGAGTFGDFAKNDAPFEVTTGARLAEAGLATEPIFGKVLDSLGTPAPGVIVIWEAPRATKIVSLSKNDGIFVLPVSNARKENLAEPFDPGSTPTETVTLEGAVGGKSVINCKPALDKPLPTVKLGENGDCNKIATAGLKPPVSSPSAEVSTNLSEGETVSTPLPTISGKAGPNQIVKIEVHSDTTYSGTVKADPAGNWSWTPPANLSVGQHSVTITVVNADGTTQTVTRTFYVSAAEPILPVTSGTPSAVLPPEPVATPPPAPVIASTPPVTGRTEQAILMLTAGLISATLGLWTMRRQPQ